MIPPSGPCARPALARARPGRPAQRPTRIAVVVEDHHGHVRVVHAGADLVRGLLHQLLGLADRRDAVSDGRQEADLLGAVTALRLGTAQRLVAALDLARPLGGARGLLLRLDEPARRLVLLGHQQRLEALVAELVERDERLGERLAVGAGPHQHVRQGSGSGRGSRARPRRGSSRAGSRARPGPPPRAGGRRRRPPSSRSSRRSSAPVHRSRASLSGIRPHLAPPPAPSRRGSRRAPGRAMPPPAASTAPSRFTPASPRGAATRCRG